MQGAENVGLRQFTWLWLDFTLDYFLQQKIIYSETRVTLINSSVFVSGVNKI